MSAKVGLISLGCAKNLVDSEIMVGHLHQAGMTVIPEAEKADVVIVNTCSFIDSSKEESIGHILELNEQRGMKKRRQDQKLIVAGCMSQRFAKDLPNALPEVDAFIGLDQVAKMRAAAGFVDVLAVRGRVDRDHRRPGGRVDLRRKSRCSTVRAVDDHRDAVERAHGPQNERGSPSTCSASASRSLAGISVSSTTPRHAM